jgi:regulator of sigma E protease
MSVVLLVIGIILFIGLVVIHEWGHFIMARRNGVEVEEFGIFFPPRLYKKRIKSKKGNWNFTINLLPLGGFVKLKGEHDTDTEPGSFGAASLWAKSKIMAAGVMVNFIAALILLMIVAWLGMPKLVDNQFTVKSDTKVIKNEVLAGYIEPGSPAAKGGLKSEDHLLALGPARNLQKIKDSNQLFELTNKYAGKKVNLLYQHQGQHRQATITLRSDEAVKASQKTNNPKGHLGVVPSEYTLQRSTWSAPIVALGLAKQFTVLTFQGLGHALSALFHGNTHAASAQVAGPVGIFVILKDGSLLGYQFILLIVAVISLTLAIMNILPIPALDGGRLWITLAMRALKRPLSPGREEAVNAAGFVFLLALIVLITIVDVHRFL